MATYLDSLNTDSVKSLSIICFLTSVANIVILKCTLGSNSKRKPNQNIHRILMTKKVLFSQIEFTDW